MFKPTNSNQSLQTIANQQAINHTALGRSLQAFCLRNDVISLLPGFGFMDGGCLALAKALQQSLSGFNTALAGVVDRDMVQHVVLRLDIKHGTVFLDADGVATCFDVKHKMTILESLQDPSLIRLDLYADRISEIDSFNDNGIPYLITHKLKHASILHLAQSLDRANMRGNCDS